MALQDSQNIHSLILQPETAVKLTSLHTKVEKSRITDILVYTHTRTHFQSAKKHATFLVN